MSLTVGVSYISLDYPISSNIYPRSLEQAPDIKPKNFISVVIFLPIVVSSETFDKEES